MEKQTKMIKRVYNGVRLALMLDPRHKKRDTKCSVVVRVSGDYTCKYIAHGDTCSEAEFAKIAKAGSGALFEKRKEWERFFDNIYNSVKNLMDDGTFCIQSYRAPGQTVQNVTLCGMFLEYIGGLEDEDRATTAHIYRSVMNKIADLYGDIPAAATDAEFVKGFRRKLEDGGASQTTQGIYLRHLRSVINYGIHKGYLKSSQYPFSQGRYHTGSVRIPTGVRRTERFLDKADMRRLYDGYPDDRSVNMFLFSYLANGANLIDIVKLRFDEWWTKSGGRELRFVRQKTRDTASAPVPIYVPVTEHLAEVMRRLGIEAKKGALLFPDALKGCDTRGKEAKRVGQMNKVIGARMKAVCEEAGIDGAVSMTWARHSYKTVLIRQKVPDWFCEQMMGHTSGGVGAHYVGLFTAEDRTAYNSMLL